MGRIAESDLSAFRARAKAELAPEGRIELRWDNIVDTLCAEVARLYKERDESERAADLEKAEAAVADSANAGWETLATLKDILAIARNVNSDEERLAALDEITALAEKAVRRPVRNCDVGDPLEQATRFREERRAHERCGACELSGLSICELSWAQRPYRPKGVSKETPGGA